MFTYDPTNSKAIIFGLCQYYILIFVFVTLLILRDEILAIQILLYPISHTLLSFT